MAELFSITTLNTVKASNILDIGTVYQEVLTITTPNLPAGEYSFMYSYELNFNGQKNRPAISQVTGEFASNEHSDSIGDNDIGDKTRLYGYPFTHTGGVITTGINMKKDGSFTAQLDLNFIDIAISRIG